MPSSAQIEQPPATATATCPAGKRWSAAIFSSRETLVQLQATIAAAARAMTAGGTIDVVINGNPALASALAGQWPQGNATAHPLRLRIWSIALGDKAHALNEYIGRIWPLSELAFFIDGYARVRPDAMRLTDEWLRGRAHCLAASGVPTSGRTARRTREEMLQEGGIHGNFYALRGSTVARMREVSFHLPLGIYRTDALIGAAVNFSLDPEHHTWDSARFTVVPDATWDLDEKSWWRWSDLRTHVKRMLRQTQGMLENSAVRNHFAKLRKSAASLPRTNPELIDEWLATDAEHAQRVLAAHPLRRRALRQMKAPRDWSLAAVPPQLVHECAAAVAP